MTLGARVLGEFGDDLNRYADAKSRKNYAGTSPITRASGRSRVVLARYARNKRLADACQMWAFANGVCLTDGSVGQAHIGPSSAASCPSLETETRWPTRRATPR
jgi:hypothetical protein